MRRRPLPLSKEGNTGERIDTNTFVSQVDKQTNRQTDKQTNRQTDKQTNRQTEGQHLSQDGLKRH